MKLELHPHTVTPRSIISKLFVNGAYECFVLEDQPPAVPADTYEIKIQPSARFGRLMPFLQNVPGHEGIEIHPGNTIYDTRGCLLVGLTEGPDTVFESRAAFDALFAKFEGTSPITIEVARPIPSIPPSPTPQAIPPSAIAPPLQGVTKMVDPTPAPSTDPSTDPKSILESKTFWGLVIGLLMPYLAKHGYIVDQAGLVTDISTVVGGALALYGRITASRPVKLP